MEIPGYYYDELLRRYFKIPPAGEREMYRMGNEKEKEKEERKKVIKKEHGITDTVSLLRDRACSVSVDTSNIHLQLFEGVVRQLTQVGHLITSSGRNRAALLPARPIGGITESIKFNESRQVLSVMTEHASKWDLNNLYFTSANGECNSELYSFKTCYSRPAHFDNSWDFYERAMVTKSFISRFDCPNPPIVLFDWDTKKVSSVSWDRHSSTDNPPIALLGYEEGTFKRIDGHWKILSNDKLFTSNAAVNDIVSFSESMVVGGGSHGAVCFYDYRSNRRAMRLHVQPDGKRQSRIVKLHPLSNEQQIITSSMNSKMLLWDLRFMDVLISFPEHENSHSFTSSLLDPQENFLAAVNDNFDIIFWSLASGRVIHRLHAKYQDSRPKIAYTSHFGNPATGLPTLFVAQNDEITLYSLKDSVNLRAGCCQAS